MNTIGLVLSSCPLSSLLLPLPSPPSSRVRVPQPQEHATDISFTTSANHSFIMNIMHDQSHKRTSINELLNPVNAQVVPPPPHLDPHSGYAVNQMQPISPPGSYIPASHQHQVQGQPSYSAMNNAPGSFSLRTATWDQANHDTGMSSRRQSDVDSSPASCRYGSASASSQPVYSDHQYQRQQTRHVDDLSVNYSSDSWSSPHESASTSYGASSMMAAPMYSDDRSCKY